MAVQKGRSSPYTAMVIVFRVGQAHRSVAFKHTKSRCAYVCVCRGEVTDSKNYRVINVWTGGWLIYINNCHFYSSLYKTTFTCKLLEKKCLKHFSPFAAVCFHCLPLYTRWVISPIYDVKRLCSCLSDMPAYFACCPLKTIYCRFTSIANYLKPGVILTTQTFFNINKETLQ